MFVTSEMLKTTPGRALTNERALSDCIEACFECAQSCTACADACLDEKDVADLRACIRANVVCADLCELAGRLLSRLLDPKDELISRQVELTAVVARKCAEECGRHASMHAHCQVCMEACQRCEGACHTLLGELQQESARH
jgi:hypothetical protein